MGSRQTVILIYVCHAEKKIRPTGAGRGGGQKGVTDSVRQPLATPLRKDVKEGTPGQIPFFCVEQESMPLILFCTRTKPQLQKHCPRDLYLLLALCCRDSEMTIAF